MTDSQQTFPLPYAGLELAGDAAFVTGATAGLGRRFARVLAKAGAKVAIAGRREDRLVELAEEIAAEGGTALPVPLDVADAEAIPTALEYAATQLGTISILVNNAGMPDARMATRIPLDLIDQVLAVNLRAPFILSREVARPLIKQGLPGRIINISSMAAFLTEGNGAALYATTKGAVARMTEALAVEWASSRVNVNCIAPGSFDSEMMDGMRGRVGDEFIAAFPRKRLCDPALLDSTLLYLSSMASEAVTGTTIKVDDGQYTR